MVWVLSSSQNLDYHLQDRFLINYFVCINWGGIILIALIDVRGCMYWGWHHFLAWILYSMHGEQTEQWHASIFLLFDCWCNVKTSYSLDLPIVVNCTLKVSQKNFFFYFSKLILPEYLITAMEKIKQITKYIPWKLKLSHF